MDFYDSLDHMVINGTSNSKHFYWHINSYCNWGEPWYEGFRESMQEYRINNQALFERNYLPNMLGWYRLTETQVSLISNGCSLEPRDSMPACAGSKRGRREKESGDRINPGRDPRVESARRGGAFSPAQRTLFKDPKTEFHLEPITDGQWNLFPYHESQSYRHEKTVRQPGEPTSSHWNTRV